MKEKKEEIYRSFEGNLGAGETGYCVYEITDHYEIHEFSARMGVPEYVYRVSKSAVENPDWTDLYTIGKFGTEVRNGKLDGQVLFKGKWYSSDLIRKIQASNKDYNWQAYV